MHVTLGIENVCATEMNESAIALRRQHLRKRTSVHQLVEAVDMHSPDLVAHG